MPAHDLDDEGPLVARRRRTDAVNRLGDAVEGGVGPDRHIGAEHVVVDRGAEPGERQVRVPFGDLGADPALFHQFGHEAQPFMVEYIGGGQAAVTADDDEAVDAPFHEVLCSLQASLTGTEFVTPCRTDDRSALVHDAADAVPVHFLEIVAAVNQSAISLADGRHPGSGVKGASHSRAKGCVHPRGVAAAREDRNLRSVLMIVSHSCLV